MSECPRCHQPVDHRSLSDVELLEIVSACLSAAGDSDPWRVVEVLSARCPGSTARLQVAGLALRLLAQLGDRDRVYRLVGGQLLAELETERLDELWSAPAAEGPDR
jgi:hypothetical protein